MKDSQFIPLVTNVPCNSKTKSQSETLSVTVNYQWKGSTQSISGYAVVTQSVWYNEFDEIGSTKVNFTVPMPNSPNQQVSGYFTVSGLPLSGCAVGTNYGIKVKLVNYGEFGAKGVLTITSAQQALTVSSLNIS